MNNKKYEKLRTDFVKALWEKMDKGRQEHTDASFDKPATDLVDEITEEILDICGWSVLLYTRLKRLKKAVKRIPKNGNADP